MNNLFSISFLLCSVFALGAQVGFCAESTRQKLEPFLNQYCYECHDDEVNKGDLNLIDLDFKPQDPHNFELWEQVHDRIQTHEMPPKKKKKQPEIKDRREFLDQIRKPLVAANIKAKQELGRVQLRKLTRREYEHTMHDLLGIDLPLINLLPEDALGHGFETVSDAQQISHFTMKHYLDVADQCLREAFERAFQKEKSYQKEYSVADLTKSGRGNYRGPEKVNGYSVMWPFGLQFAGRLPYTRAPESAWYEITLKDLHAINSNTGVVWGTLKSGFCSSNAPILYMIGLVEATDEKRDVTYRAWVEKGHCFELKPNDVTLKRGKSTGKGGNLSYKNTNNLKNGIAGIAVSGIHVKKIHPYASNKEVKQNLLGSMSYQQFKDAQSQPEAYKKLLHQAVKNFANRAFRRPASQDELKPYLGLAYDAMAEPNKALLHPLYVAYRAILCSPRFLTLIERPGKLDQYEIASRLSYMLWNSMPDEQLFKAARDKKLSDPQNLIAEADRLLKHEKSERFIKSFTDQWLSLRSINETTPDRRMFRTFDGIVQESMLQETRAFFKELIQKDLSVANVLESDFNMLNERLARHYRIEGHQFKLGQGIQKVPAKNPSRNGIVTQGAIMKVTANGTNTSPVLRGVWMSEKILGLHIPAPPTNVPAIEPDVRGAVSIRDLLKKHSSSESCASCHTKIDPTGFAFENFDPAGVWRSKYGNKKNSAVVNPAGKTHDGKTFKGIVDWKKHYANNPKMLAKSFTNQLVTYATGAVPGFSDRYPVQLIVNQAEKQNFGMRSILYATITSPLFSTK